MHWVFSLFLLLMCFAVTSRAQDGDAILVKVTNTQKQPLAGATIELLKQDSSLLKVVLSDSVGFVHFPSFSSKTLIVRGSLVGHIPSVLVVNTAAKKEHQLVLAQADKSLQNVTVTARKPFIELRPDKTVINMEAGISNVGTSVMEALEKLPGVTVDKDGNISLKGRSGVMVMVDGKPTYLNGTELAAVLTGMNSSQVSQIELMDNPPAKYDAAGNAGIINIKTKKNTQRGFNGTLTTAYGQGYYPKSNNNFSLNYRSGKWNLFANYSLNYAGYFSRIYALRTYFEKNSTNIISLLEQPSFLQGRLTSHNLRTGFDYAINNNTSIGVALSGLSFNRKGGSNNPAYWMKANRQIDSVIHTISNNSTAWDNAGGSFNFKHTFRPNSELTADVDVLRYRIQSNQFFENNSVFPRNYTEAFRADIPTAIRIITAKADYAEQIGNLKLEGGWKSSKIKTDNESIYQYRDGSNWKDDWGKSNHFLYEENIHAFYGT
ncbi:MAG TPA: outer membrane beta-barrel protein, partial [Flavisolibacter sp.]|nr:outer membrane beta-barrel protein [Flavisolibacter sp.]